MAIDHIDGPRLADAVIGGSEWVASKRIHLNEINVFPVPDGDTGNNLAMTLKAASDAVRTVRDRPLGEVASALSRAVLFGARGNAGIILAQFIRGFAHEVEGVEKLYPGAFADAMRNSVQGAYDAMAEPVEGTILTVVRESVEEVSRLVESGETDYEVILERMHAAAAESLSRTPELLPVLKEAGVVDAGGEGFVDLLEGMLRVVRGQEVGRVLELLPPVLEEALPAIKERDLKYRFCTEFLVEGPGADTGDLKVKLAGLGGSLVVVGAPGLVRVHVHTNEPEKAIEAASELGAVEDTKIDDMREQHREFIRTIGTGRSSAVPVPDGSPTAESEHRPRRRSRGDRRRKGVRIVTDSTADLPPGLAEDLGITVVPLRVHFDDGSFRDGVDITNEGFYEKLEAAATPPTTSQPTPHEFIEVYERLSWETKAVLSIHISSAMSGTMQSARAAGQAVDGVKVLAVDSLLTSAPLGMVVAEAARAAQSGAQLPELTTLVSNLSVRARVFFTVGSLDHLVKGGRIGRARALIGKLARLKPILTIEDGTVTTAGKARGDEGVLAALLELAAPELEGETGGTLGLMHARRPGILGRVESAFRERFGFDEVQVSQLGSIVGTHAGPGTWGVSYFARRRATKS